MTCRIATFLVFLCLIAKEICQGYVVVVNEYLAVYCELRKFVGVLEGYVSHWRVGIL